MLRGGVWEEASCGEDDRGHYAGLGGGAGGPVEEDTQVAVLLIG